MSETREFDLSDVLSVSTGCLVAERGMEAIYDVMGYLLCDNSITTIGLMMCAEQCEAGVLAQHPQLAAVNASLHLFDLTNADERRQWLAANRARYGDRLTLHPITDTPSAPSLDAQVAEVLSINPNIEVLTVEAPDA